MCLDRNDIRRRYRSLTHHLTRPPFPRRRSVEILRLPKVVLGFLLLEYIWFLIANSSSSYSSGSIWISLRETTIVQRYIKRSYYEHGCWRRSMPSFISFDITRRPTWTHAIMQCIYCTSFFVIPVLKIIKVVSVARTLRATCSLFFVFDYIWYDISTLLCMIQQQTLFERRIYADRLVRNPVTWFNKREGMHEEGCVHQNQHQHEPTTATTKTTPSTNRRIYSSYCNEDAAEEPREDHRSRGILSRDQFCPISISPFQFITS